MSLSFSLWSIRRLYASSVAGFEKLALYWATLVVRSSGPLGIGKAFKRAELLAKHSGAGEIGNEGWKRLRQPESQPLVGKEEERPVLHNRATQSATKVVLALLGFRQRRIVRVTVEPIVRVKNIVSQVVKGSAVKLIRP